MKKRVLSLLLIFTLLVGLFVACGDKAETPAAETPDSKTESKASEEGAKETPETAKTSKITVEIFDRGTDGGKTDAADNFYTDWIKEQVLEELNIEVDFFKVSRWEETEQLNNLMAAGNAPDVCLTYDGNLIANFRDLGGLTDLSPYIDEYLGDLREFLGPDTAVEGKDLIVRNEISETGEIFSIPARRMNTAQVGTFVRGDWLETLDMEPPSTTDEFYEMLVAFKEQDPGGVGSDNIIPFTMTRDVRWRAGTLLDSFIQPELTEEELWVNSVIDRKFLYPGYKEGFRMLNKMYNEGLVDPEFPLYTDDTDSDNLIKSGVVGAFIHNWDQAYRDTPGIYKDLEENVPGAEFISVDCFVNSAGKTYKGAYDPAGVNFFIPADSENVIGALQYINWLSKFDNRYFLQIGEEGVTHEMVDGVPKLMPTEGPQIMNSPQNIDYTIMINGLDAGNPDKTAEALAFSYNVESELIRDAYDNAIRDAEASVVIPGITLSAAGPVSQTLVDKAETLMAEAVTTTPENFDTVWDSGIEDWLASGAQTVIDERAEKYAEYIAEQG